MKSGSAPPSSLDRAIKIAGGQVALASLIGKGQSTISLWRQRGKVPADVCRAIEIATDGEVTRYQLRPDVFATEPAKRSV